MLTNAGYGHNDFAVVTTEALFESETDGSDAAFHRTTGAWMKALKSLGVKPDKISHTSDHFATIMSKAKELLKTGQAYMDDTEQLMMSQQRRNGQPNVAARARKPKEFEDL